MKRLLSISTRTFLIFLFIAALLGSPQKGSAFSLIVDRTDDDASASACTAAPNDCSLRGAIIFANTNPGSDTISLPDGTYNLSIEGNNEDSSLTGDLDVNDSSGLTINGEDAETAIIHQTTTDRVLHIQSGNFTLRNTTISGGYITSYAGGLYNVSGAQTIVETSVFKDNAGSNGGAIYNESGTVKISESFLMDNTSLTGGGGGIANYSNLTLTECTLSNNTTASGGYQGAGIYNAETGSLTAKNSQFSTSIGSGAGAGIANRGTANITNSTNGIFNTISCGPLPGAGGVKEDDAQITINQVTYNNSSYTASLSINNATGLPTGNYRLFLCATATLKDLGGRPIHSGSDYTFDFSVFTNNSSLPATGFPQGFVSLLSVQPAENTYSDLDMVLEIPALNQKMTIMGIPRTKDGWDITWLGDKAGYLQGSAFPTWAGNTVLTGHVWDAYDQPGPFAELKSLQYSEQILIHAWDMTYVYEVREIKLVSPRNVNSVLQHEDFDWLTLLTCENFDSSTGGYYSRRMVRAVLVNTY